MCLAADLTLNHWILLLLRKLSAQPLTLGLTFTQGVVLSEVLFCLGGAPGKTAVSRVDPKPQVPDSAPREENEEGQFDFYRVP